MPWPANPVIVTRVQTVVTWGVLFAGGLVLGCSSEPRATAAPSAGGTGGSGGASAGTGGNGVSGASSGGAAPVSYRNDIEPLFADHCLPCHASGNPEVNIEDPFAPTTGLVNAPNAWAANHPDAGLPAREVVPGDPDASFVMMKVTSTMLPPNAGEPMPFQVPRLTDAEVAAIRSWIAAGAPNDATFTATVQPIFGIAGKWGAAADRCSYCHFTGGQEPDLTDPFNPTTGIVGVASKASTLERVAPGEPDQSFLMVKVTSTTLPPVQGAPMPFHPPRLTTDEAALLRRWIAEGASDN